MLGEPHMLSPFQMQEDFYAMLAIKENMLQLS